MSNEDDYQTYKEVGSICFKNHTIEIDDITFALNQLDELKFKVAGYNGQGNAYSKVIHDGSRNFISFNQNGETHIFQFLLLYQDQVKQLKEILQLYYDQELTIIEYYQGNRSYLLNKNLSYNEIQLLKTRFNIEMWI
ncbi:hypothetical protein [Sediminitomix flava]|uniref:Uncharacterized protein n=1 Tax=Sediminitomix flava TaxID=379075 RepID=A0A316A4Q8_SEDFL|nr:hypothetical protein [Sediminitomix flava]PWJ44747.1 hypothetical protein BC781_1011118 [Sediminitomix flava]